MQNNGLNYYNANNPLSGSPADVYRAYAIANGLAPDPAQYAVPPKKKKKSPKRQNTGYSKKNRSSCCVVM